MWTKNPVRGYGYVSAGRRSTRAHRVSYELFKGKIPKDLCLDHLCSTRTCINPSHLEAVTFKENSRRTVRRGRHNFRKRVACTKGHIYTEKSTYWKLSKLSGSMERVCRICNDQNQLKRYRENRKRLQEQSLAYYHKNKEKIKAKRKLARSQMLIKPN